MSEKMEKVQGGPRALAGALESIRLCTAQKPAAQKESPTKQGGKGTKANPNPKKN